MLSKTSWRWSPRLLIGALALAAACSPDGLAGPSEPEAGGAMTATALLSCTNYDVTDLSSAYQGWAQALSEDFSTDLSQWSIWTGGAWNEELQYYQKDNLDLTGGKLVISARMQEVTGVTNPYDATLKTFQYTSGRIESGRSFSASRTTPRVRIAARLRLPAGAGMWPAFWSYGDPWPTQGEIDILEARGQEPDRFQTAYWFGRRRGVNQAQNTVATILTGVSLTACWHVYELVWEKDRLTFYFDGAQVDQKTGGYVPNMYGKSQRVTLNLAVGGAFFTGYPPYTIDPGDLEADWVRVFTSR